MPGGWWCCCTPGCSGCTECCTDSMPNSLDITFGSGWTEPTVDANKMGCNDVHADACAAQLDGQTFNLPSVGIASPGWCHAEGGIGNAPLCGYQYVDTAFCPTEFDICTAYNATLNLWAWFQCRDTGLCRIRVKAEICASCGFGPVKTGRSDYWWNTADFALNGEVCSGLSKTATFITRISYDDADSEGFCKSPPGAPALNLTVDDGG